MARTLRHEIGDFLQKVYASVALLEARLPPECRLEREILNQLHKGAESCRWLIDAIQDFLCPISANLEAFDLAKIVAGNVAEFRDRHPNWKVLLETRDSTMVLADPKRMGQVAAILLANAGEGSGDTIDVKMRPLASGGPVEWTVTDNGSGPPMDIVKRLFDPFVTTKSGHAGLGLALARKLVLAQKAEIAAANLPQGGFQIRIVVPVAAP